MNRLLLLLIFLLSPAAYPHGGGLDSKGGHSNRKTGDYHCHREPCISTHSQVGEATKDAELEGRAFSSLYNRDDWDHWIDADGDCQDTRAEVLIRDSQRPVSFDSGGQCKVASGLWERPYTGGSATDASQLDIDHTGQTSLITNLRTI
jgi:hypothetical protein